MGVAQHWIRYRYPATRLLREIGFCILVLLVATFLVLLALRFMPGDPTNEMAKQVRSQSGFDKPLFAQYAYWWDQVLLHGDFASSFDDGAPVKSLLMAHAWKTGLLALLAMGVTILLAVPLGAGHAFHESSRLWKSLFTIFDSISSLPLFVIAYLLLWLFAKLISPQIPTNPETGGLSDWIWAFALMSCVLAIGDGTLGEVARLVRLEIRDLLDKEFMLSLRARGLRIHKHLFKNACLPIFSFLMARMTYFLSGVVVIEKIFSFEGLGYLTLQRAENRDAPVLLGICFALVSFVLVCHFVGELIANFMSPYREK